MTNTVTIQPQQPGRTSYDPSARLPYPWHLDVSHAESAFEIPVLRQDFWKGNPRALLGFARGDVHEIALTLADFADDPQRAVGMKPVFISDDDEVWSTEVDIASVHDHRSAGT